MVGKWFVIGAWWTEGRGRSRRWISKQLRSPGLQPSWWWVCSDACWIFFPYLDRCVQGLWLITVHDREGSGWLLANQSTNIEVRLGVIFKSGSGKSSRLMWVIAGAGEGSVPIWSPAQFSDNHKSSAWTSLSLYSVLVAQMWSGG